MTNETRRKLLHDWVPIALLAVLIVGVAGFVTSLTIARAGAGGDASKLIRVHDDFFVDDDGDLLPILKTSADDTTSGENLLVAASAGDKIVVVGWVLSTDTATNVHFSSDPLGTPTAISQSIYLAASGGFTSSHRERWYETVSGEALGIDINDTANTGHTILYVLDDD